MPRDPHHDYRSVCIYHITINKAKATPDFCKISGSLEKPATDYSAIGYVVKNTVNNLRDINGSLQVLQYAVMPDHVHILIYVRQYLQHHLGAYISMLKIRILQKLRSRQIYSDSVFESDYYDRILRPWHSLQVIFDYIRQNPRRLLARRLLPDYFRRTRALFNFSDINWHTYGNQDLLHNPFKESVVCHRKEMENEEIKRMKWERWEYSVLNGGVLVSPFISPEEKKVKKMAEDNGGKLILIINEAMGDRFKPGGHYYELCEQGRLLIIAPQETIPPGRACFLRMNALADMLAYPRR